MFLLGPRNFILGLQVGLHQQMTPINFEVTRLKVKVTVVKVRSVTLVFAQ